MMRLFALVFLAAFTTSCVLGGVCRFVLRAAGVVDHPNARSSHRVPTVRGGGLSIIATVLLGAVFWPGGPFPFELKVLLALALALAAVSFLDDVKSLPSWLRFGCHSLAAALFLAALGRGGMKAPPIPRSIWPAMEWAVWLAAFIWLVGYANAFNFMDGINGLAAGQAVVTSLGTALLLGVAGGLSNANLIMMASMMAGAAAGFLPHNFPKARMFMGDAGSIPLGFMLAGLALCAAKRLGLWILVPLLLLHANFILDTGLTLARRLARGDRWFSAHREHYYQKLVRSGASHTAVTLLETAVQLIVLMMVLAYVFAGPPARVILAIAVPLLWLYVFASIQSRFRYRIERDPASPRAQSSG